MPLDGQLEGFRALVTGGSGDLGSAIATALAEDGADVAASYHGRSEAAAQTVRAVEERGRRGFAVPLDQRDPASIEACARAAVEQLGGVDILVNNAAWNVGIPFPDLESLTREVFDRVLETNLRGPYLLTRALAAELRRQRRGRVVNIASVGGIVPSSSSIAYSASKAALIHLTHCLAVALAPDVTVNCVAPGLIEGTRMARRLPEEVAEAARAAAVLGRVAAPADIARQVVAFCRHDSVTGQTLVVDGGMPQAMR